MPIPKSKDEMAALPAQEQLSLIREYGVATGYRDSIMVSDLQLGGVGLAIAELERALDDAAGLLHRSGENYRGSSSAARVRKDLLRRAREEGE